MNFRKIKRYIIIIDILLDNKRIFLRASSSLESSSETGSSGNYRLPREISTTSSDGCESLASSPKPNRSRYRSPKR